MTTSSTCCDRIGRCLIGTVAGAVLAIVSFGAFAPEAQAGPPLDHCCGGGDAKAPAAEAKAEAPKAKKGMLIDLANRACPIMGGKPDGKTYSEWNGLRISHCCGGCIKKFAADPESHLKKAGIDWKAAAAAIEKVESSTGKERTKALAAVSKKWKVLREPAPDKSPLLIALGNEKCPIMGGKADGKTFSEWNGLQINHCCAGCIKKFAKDPEGALKKAGIQWKKAAAAVTAVTKADGKKREKLMTALRKKWKVVREPVAETAEKPERKPSPR